MRKSIIISLVLAVLLAIIAVQNNAVVTFKLLFWDINISMALLIFAVIILGCLLGIALMLPTLFQRKKTIKEKERLIKELNDNRILKSGIN